MKLLWGLLLITGLSVDMCIAAVGQRGYDLKAEYVHGWFSNKNCRQKEIADGYPIPYSGCDFPEEVIPEDRLKAAKGLDFGIVYRITGLKSSSCHTVTHFLNHPVMTLPDGTRREQYQRNFKIGSCMKDEGRYVDFFSWSLEESWEVERGEWIFEIRVDGNTLIKERFILE